MKEELQSLLCLKVNVEYQKFKKEQLQCSVEDVYFNSYKIQSYMCIYEHLLEISQNVSEDVLVSLITFPELLAFFYERWLKMEDSSDEELMCCLQHEISEIHDEMFIRKGGLAA